ncbi:menaquinone biosynthesis protein [Omnitrophica bacterium]|nr:menaquinone biosynthesis protein [Candidatus Omnitrophota bacterium]
MKSHLKTKLRIGKISYTNCLPFFHGLFEQEPEGYEIHETYPSKINQLMNRGRVDIAPISSLEYLNHQKNYFLLPSLVIGSRDFSGSVLLLSKERIEGLGGSRIALSQESLSSATLLKILLKSKYKLSNTFQVCEASPQQMLKENIAALAIGDKALFYESKEFIYRYDLSELWWNWTEKPFCFALWAVRKTFAKQYPSETSAFCKRLRNNLERNLVDLETLIRSGLGLSFTDRRFSKIFGYLFNLSYGLDSEMREGLELFYRLAHRLEISPRAKPLEFFEESCD